MKQHHLHSSCYLLTTAGRSSNRGASTTSRSCSCGAASSASRGPACRTCPRELVLAHLARLPLRLRLRRLRVVAVLAHSQPLLHHAVQHCDRRLLSHQLALGKMPTLILSLWSDRIWPSRSNITFSCSSTFSLKPSIFSRRTELASIRSGIDDFLGGLERPSAAAGALVRRWS